LIKSAFVSIFVVVACYGLLDLVSRAGVQAEAKVLLALLTGAGVAAFALLPLLFFWPNSSTRLRVKVAVSAAFLAHAVYLGMAIAWR
jgi:hypothetical protein